MCVVLVSMMTACGSSKSSKENKDTTKTKAETTHMQKQSMHQKLHWFLDGVLTVGSRNRLCTI